MGIKLYGFEVKDDEIIEVFKTIAPNITVESDIFKEACLTTEKNLSEIIKIINEFRKADGEPNVEDILKDERLEPLVNQGNAFGSLDILKEFVKESLNYNIAECFGEKENKEDFSQCSTACLLANDSCLRGLGSLIGERVCGQCLATLESELVELKIDESISENFVFLGEVDEITFVCDKCGWWRESHEQNLYLGDCICDDCMSEYEDGEE